MKTARIGFLFCVLFFTGCAYFNVFYNAKRYYRKGYEETRRNRTGQPTAGETQNYQRAIEKCAKLIQEYPDSKWVDDALMLMGKAYYHQNQAMRANRKFIELLTNYPHSPYAPEARLWLAKTYLALDQLDEAERALKTLLQDELPRTLSGEAHYFLGRLYNRQKRYAEAVTSYEKAFQAVHKELKAQALFEVGANYDSLGVYDKAAEAFKGIDRFAPVPSLKEEAQFQYARMLKKKGSYDEAIKRFEAMLLNPLYQKRYPRIRLEIAECLARKGDVRGALMAYEDLTKENKGDEAAEAYYRMGRLYESLRDYEKALESFKKVRGVSGRSLYADSADGMARDIERLKALRLVVRMGLRGEKGRLVVQERTEEDTLTVTQLFTRLDSIRADTAKRALIVRYRGQAFLDSLLEEAALPAPTRLLPQWRDRLQRRQASQGIDWIAWLEKGSLPTDEEIQRELPLIRAYQEKTQRQRTVENEALRAYKVEEVDRNLFYLAELYLFRFNQVDSAVAAYRKIHVTYPTSPFASRALYNLAYISEAIHHDAVSADTAYRRLVQDYPNTSVGRIAAQKLGVSPPAREGEEIADAFHEAERLLFDREDPRGAYRRFRWVFERAPESEWGIKALYALGWISENRLDSLNQAVRFYEDLVKRFPETEFAKRVQPKLAVFKEAEGAQDQPASPVPAEPAGSMKEQSSSPFSGSGSQETIDSADSSRQSPRIDPR